MTKQMTASEFLAAHLQPAARLAHEHGLLMSAVVAEAEPHPDGDGLLAGRVVSTAQVGTAGVGKPLLAELLRLEADHVMPPTPEPAHARFVLDPMAVMLQVFNDLYPGHDVTIEYKAYDDMPVPTPQELAEYPEPNPEAEGMPAAGCAIFKEDGSEPPRIWLCHEVTMTELPTVLAEELAHVVAGHAAGHGPEFQAVMDRLQAEFEARCLEQHAS